VSLEQIILIAARKLLLLLLFLIIIVKPCPLTKFEGGLNLLHEADDDTVIWLESTVTAALAK